jgi:hypothetical protein
MWMLREVIYLLSVRQLKDFKDKTTNNVLPGRDSFAEKLFTLKHTKGLEMYTNIEAELSTIK